MRPNDPRGAWQESQRRKTFLALQSSRSECPRCLQALQLRLRKIEPASQYRRSVSANLRWIRAFPSRGRRPEPNGIADDFDLRVAPLKGLYHSAPMLARILQGFRDSLYE